MTYKSIVIPNSKQQRITIPKELELEPGKEIVILYLDDYKQLIPSGADKLNDKIVELEKEKNELIEKIGEIEKINKSLADDIEEKNIKLARYDKDKTKLDKLETKLEDITKLYTTCLEKLTATHENTSKDIIDNVSNDYKNSIKNIGFMDRLLNRINVDIDLNKYKDDLKEDYAKQLEESRDKIYLVEKIDDDEIIDVE